jgi:galactoside O-acetyltransferase
LNNQAESLHFATIGLDVVIWPVAKIIKPEVISIGDSVIIDDFVLIMGGVKTKIGSFVHIASFVSVTGGGEFEIEDFAGISSGCRILTGNDDFLGGSLTGPTIPSSYRSPIRSYVHIKKHAIVGANTVILPGVTIGEGTAVGANSLVKTDLDPWTIYAGSPAKPLRMRPHKRILALEAQLHAEMYDKNNQYIPRGIFKTIDRSNNMGSD